MRPRLLDLFCGAGGAAMGYHRAGFDVTGVDIKPQPRYPFRFIQKNALDVLSFQLYQDYDAIHASPPCQAFTAYRRRPGVGEGYPDLIGPVRDMLRETGKPWVIENVPGAPMRPDVMLCGSSFGLHVRRHRWFESPVPMLSPPCNHGAMRPAYAPASNRTNLRSTVEVGVWRIPLELQRAAMGINWMFLSELTEAIPPAYTEYIGRALLGHLGGREVA